MNLAKHMEAVFVVALAAVGSASYIAPTVERADARPAILDASVATETRMAVVVVKGKRPTPAERNAVVLAARDDSARRG